MSSSGYGQKEKVRLSNFHGFYIRVETSGAAIHPSGPCFSDILLFHGEGFCSVNRGGVSFKVVQ